MVMHTQGWRDPTTRYPWRHFPSGIRTELILQNYENAQTNLFHRMVPGATGRCQVPQDAARSHRTLSGPTGRCQVPQDAARSDRTLPGPTGRCQVPQDAVRSHRTLPGPTGRCQVPQDAARSSKIAYLRQLGWDILVEIAWLRPLGLRSIG
jgi:hypothetical protein